MAGDCLITIDQVAGEGGDAQVPGALAIKAWNWGASVAPSSEQPSESRVKLPSQVREFVFSYEIDTSTSQLMSLCGASKLTPKAVLTMRRAGGKAAQKYLEITFKQVAIRAVELLNDPNNVIPLVTVRFGFHEVMLDYSAQSEQGGSKSGKSSFFWTYAK